MKKSNSSIKKLIDTLVDMEVTLYVSEPWDFGTEVGVGPFPVVIEQVSIRFHAYSQKIYQHESLLLRLKSPFAYQNLKCEFLLASPRHEGHDLQKFVLGDPVSFNFLRIPSLRAQSDDPFSSESKWRGSQDGFVLIGSIEKIR
jgi:hypothetical protein